MNEAVVQALIKGVVIFVIAGLTALGLNAAELVQIGTQGDPITGPLTLSIVTALIGAILKWIGGPTTDAPVTHGRSAPAGSFKRPSIFSV